MLFCCCLEKFYLVYKHFSWVFVSCLTKEIERNLKMFLHVYIHLQSDFSIALSHFENPFRCLSLNIVFYYMPIVRIKLTYQIGITFWHIKLAYHLQHWGKIQELKKVDFDKSATNKLFTKMKVVYNALFKRTSTFALGILGSVFFFERGFDVVSESIFESCNRGVSIILIYYIII